MLAKILEGGFLKGKKRYLSILALSAMQIFPQYGDLLMAIGTTFGLWSASDSLINKK